MNAATRNIQKKLTVNILNGKKKPDVMKLAEYLIKLPEHERASAVMPICTIIGRASAFEAGESDYGPYVKLLGQFSGVNVETGEEMVSGTAILPGAASDLIYAAVRSLGDAGGAIDFAFRIGIRQDKEAATGYVYDVQQIIQPGQSDPLAELKKLAGISGGRTLEHKPEAAGQLPSEDAGEDAGDSAESVGKKKLRK